MPNLVLRVLVTPVLAQATPEPGPGSSLFPIVMLLMLGGMYFLMIAPQNKKRKELQKMISSLATGDEILTVGGIFGVITNVKPDRLVVKIAEGTKVEISRASVQSVEKKAATE
jgi:preprotein translocase subunit YajC